MRKDLPKRDPYKEKVLDLRRVARVMAGGKRFKFRATVAVGDERGRAGIGVGKGADVSQAIAKGRAAAVKNIITVPLWEGRTIPHEVQAKFSAARVILKPASAGRGLKAGGAVRSVLAMVGVRDATAKCLGRTSNKLTNAWATIGALASLKSSTPFNRRPKEEPAKPESAG
ncbi:MAG: 30S ribosomal protein S5 [Candidatus Liptonbacteria bacterium]|nr:30S ribosomal protein S5 [Candidatus Liptonbacteria bacterium]